MAVSRFNKALLTTVSAASLLTACAVGPNYQRPELVKTEGYDSQRLADRVTVGEGADAANQHFTVNGEIAATWWHAFHAEELNRVMDQAFAANPDLEAAEASLRVAQENAAASFGDIFPTISASAGSTREKTGGASSGGRNPGSIFTLHNASVGVSYGLDVFGGTRRVIEEEEAKQEYQGFQLEAARLTLSANVVTTAVQEASLRAQLEITRNIVNAYQRHVDLVRRQRDAGAVAEGAVLTAQAALEQARANLPALEKQLAQTRHAFSALLGLPPDREPPAVFDLCRLKLPEELPVSVAAKLIDQRPDVRAAEANLHAASAAIGVAIAQRLPGIKLTGNIGTQANTLSQLFMPGGGIWSFGASVSETIFDAGTLAHKQGVAEAEFDVARAQYRKAVLAALQDVADVLHALQSDAASFRAQDSAFRAADHNYALAKQQFDAGAINLPTVITSEITRDQAQLQRVQAVAKRYADTAALFQALGGGWWNHSTVEPQAAQETQEISTVEKP